MAGNNHRIVRQSEHGTTQRLHNLLHGSTGEIGAADGSGEQRIARKQNFFGREVKADAAFGVPGRVQNAGRMRAGFYAVAGSNALIDFYRAWGRHADPGGLHVEHLEQSKIVLVEQDRRSRGRAQFHRTAHMIDMGMGDDDVLDLQVMLAKQCEDVVNVVAGVDDHRFPSGLIANNRAIAVQRADREDLMDHAFIVAN